MQPGSLQSPSLLSQVRPGAHGNSLSSQKWRQTPWLQTSLVAQRLPSSTMPLQSLSRVSPFSVLGIPVWRQVVVVPPAAHSVTPPAQIPIALGTVQGSPPRLQDRPDTKNTKSLKSPSLPLPGVLGWFPVQPRQLCVQVGWSSKAM